MGKTEITFTIRVSKSMRLVLGIVIEFSLYTFHLFTLDLFYLAIPDIIYGIT